MSEGVTVDLDFSKLNSRIEELHDALIGSGQGGDAATVFQDEARLFAKQIIRLTPPKNRQQGEAAIDRDLMKLFEPVNSDWVDDLVIAHGHNNIDQWITSASGDPKHIKWTYLDNTGGPMKDFHNRNRDNRGRAYNLKRQRDPSVWYAPYVVGYDKFTEYAKRIKSHVGRRKAAWALSFERLGGSVSNWIHRHVSGAKGEFHANQDPIRPSIVMTNRAPGIMDDLHFVRGAMRVRQEAIGRRMRLILSGYSKDMARGMKITRQAHKTPESFSEAA